MFRQTITRLRAHAPLSVLALGIIVTCAHAARAQGATRLYVADYRNARVAVFDPKAIEPKQNYEQVEATPFWVQTGAQPFGVVASPDGRRVYTANYGSDNVSVIDTTAKPNPVRLYDVAVGDGPYQLALSPDAKTLYVSNFEGHSVTALALDTGAAIPPTKWTLPLPYSPTGMVVTPNGRYLFVNQYQDWKTLVVDLSPAVPQVVNPIQVGPAPVAIAMSKDGTKVYVANEFDQFIQWGASLSIIDAADPEHASESKRIQLTTGSSPRGQMALSGNGRWLFISNGGTANVTTVDLLDEKIVAETRTVPDMVGAVLSPDGGLLYASNQGNSLSIVDTGTFQNRKDILVPFQLPNEPPAMFECAALVTLPACAQ
ncbi:MAG: beta-propeller fold lactonase family protein [Acidobacteria bacterium]|nr:beta-propeller fold lactonase family protein [Acidobacteriota bacterium]